MPALAKLLPSTSVASKSCGSDNKRLMILARAGERDSNWRNCHLPSENREVSASAKKKLAPAKRTRTTNARVGVIAARLSQKGKGKRQKWAKTASSGLPDVVSSFRFFSFFMPSAFQPASLIRAVHTTRWGVSPPLSGVIHRQGVCKNDLR